MEVDTKRLLLVAAAEPTGDPVLIWRVAGELGIGKVYAKLGVSSRSQLVRLLPHGPARPQ